MHWLVSFPAGVSDDEKEKTWNLVNQRTTQDCTYSVNDRLHVPKLRVGTLDSLMALSDDLVKVNVLMDGMVQKIKRQSFELGTSGSLLVEGVTPREYVKKFAWDEAKYPSNRPLKDTVEKIQDTVVKVEDDMKVKLSEYNQLKGLLSTAARKSTGSLAVRDLFGIVEPADVQLESEYMTVLLVVVSKFSMKDWENTYETLNAFVVPRSSKVLHGDNEYNLVKVVVFIKEVENFKAAARVKGFQVRDYNIASLEHGERVEELEGMKEEAHVKKQHLEDWCTTAYGEVYSAWVHILVIRLFVESVLRYGLPPSFVAGVMEPKAKTEKRLKMLLTAFGDPSWVSFKDDGSSAGILGPVGESDSLPYVCFNLQLEE